MQLDETSGKLSEAASKLELVKAQNESFQALLEEAAKEKRALEDKNERLTADLEELLLK